MPNRSTLNKYELFVTEVRRIAKKRQVEASDSKVRKMAMLIAALSSNQSWKTSRYICEGGEMDKLCMISESRHAFDEGWKNITEADIEEVINSRSHGHTFSMWLWSIVPKEQREELRKMHSNLVVEFADGLEPIERKVY
ncbi:MAG: hypothetical protein KGH49_03270 [Candidatus Micrarchaeota archaeon]|nr:hypothetical protein [Candidatus Micrarchaeota archaeon]